MKKTFTLFMALALVTSLFAVPHNPKQFVLEKQKVQTEQNLTQRVPVAKTNITRKAVRKATMEESTTTTFTYTSVTDTLQTKGGIKVQISKAKGQSAPQWNETSSHLRIYASNTITVTADSITKVELTCTKGKDTKDYASLTASTGKLVSGGASSSSTDSKTDTWTGNANNVVFTLGDGQRAISQIVVTLGGQGGGGGEEEITISGLTQAYAIYFQDGEGYYWDFDLAVEFDEEATTYPELYFMCDDEASSKTSIVGTYSAYYAAVWNSAKDSVETDEDEAVGTMTVTYVEEGVYNFSGSFEGTDGKTYKWNATNVAVIAVDADNDYELIELDETGGGGVYSITEAKTAYDGGVIKQDDVIAIKGYISGMFLKPTNFSKYGSVTVWLAEEEGGTSKEFQLYNCYGLDGDTLTAFSPEATGSSNVDVTTVSNSTCSFSVGDYVEATGKIKSFGTTYELQTGCYLTKIVPAAGGDTTEVKNIDALEIDYYPSYSEVGAYDYTFLLYNSTDENYVPMVAFDILTTTEKAYAGTYTMQGGTLTEYSYYVYGTGDEDYLEFTDGEITITDNGNGNYTVKGWFTDGTKVYTVDVTLDGEYFNAEYAYEPETKSTLNLTVTSGEIDDSYAETYGIIDIYLTTAEGEVQLEYYIPSTATTLEDGTYPIEAAQYDEEYYILQTYGFFDAGYYYSSYGMALASYYETEEEIYYLVSGTVKVETVEGGKKITLAGTTYYGSTINAVYTIATTALQTVKGGKVADGKYLMGGQLLIQKNGVLYNAQGQIIER